MVRFGLSFVVLTLVALTTLSSSLLAQDTAQAAQQVQNQQDQIEETDPAQDRSLIQKVSKILAYRFFSTMKQEGADIDLDQFVEGAKLAIDSQELGITDEEAALAMAQFEQLMVRRSMEKRQALSESNLVEADTFAAENKAKEGVIVLESGVQYRVIKAGDGASPEITDRVMVNYSGRLLNGEVFDTTKGGEPATFAVGGLIRGMTEALQKMKVGDTIEVFIPGSSAYGETGPKDRMGRPRMDSPIGPNAALIFELELLEIVKE